MVKRSGSKSAEFQSSPSKCFDCRRAYAQPFSEGGCEKILNGTPVYKKAKEVIKSRRDKKQSYIVLVVTECDYYESDY